MPYGGSIQGLKVPAWILCSNFTLLPEYRKENPRTFAEAFSRFHDMQNDNRKNLQDIDAAQIQGVEPLHSGKT
jgi:hypothetical protein